ncbi:thiamine phosphate synthase [Catenovulum sp. SM1970]|uniref:thiamine phosphate synthase n=1 Tax=Marinifaba aquimaris TaxID=2741323 RepID=UPI001572FB71|nr:thiamine phosphate synthase [Marinifaba aquimaris]NTS77132.1 thiamine phosphate synthase [Marinifaba aquimaris]
MYRPIVWSIAGSDPTAGAGIQADVKTLHNLGCDACSVITAVTAQNSQGVLEINAVSDDVLWSQLAALEQDKIADVIKIGLLSNKRQVLAISEFIQKAKDKWPEPPRVVYDPVAIASSGGDLTEEDILPTIKTKLLPLVDVLTPNANEVQRIAGIYLIGWDSVEQAGRAIIEMGVGAVIIKGGHMDIDRYHCVDYCTDGQQHFWLASPKIDTEHTHGTGCTYASAVAAALAQDYLLRDAIVVAKAFINQGLAKSQHFDARYAGIWQGQWPTEHAYFPNMLTPGSALAKELDWCPESSFDSGEAQRPYVEGFAQTDTTELGLYPVVDSVEWIERLLKAGVKTIQIRLKNKTNDELESAIARAVELQNQYQARLFINDYWQLAIKHKAYGVHLGQEDILDANLAEIKAAGLRLGISTHGYYEMLKVAQLKPSYLAIGAIYPTVTKDMTGQIQGLDRLEKFVKLLPDMPFVAIGGINLTRAVDVAATGVGSIAVVTAITLSEQPETVVEQFNQIIEQAQ